MPVRALAIAALFAILGHVLIQSACAQPAPDVRTPASKQFTQTQPAQPVAPQPPQQTAPQPPAQSPPPQPVRTEILKFDSWTATCHEFAESTTKRSCAAQLQIQQSGSSQVILSWTVLINDNKQLVSVLQTPTGVAIMPGVDLKLEKAAPRKLAYESCDTGHCTSTQVLDNNLVRDMTAATTVQVTVQAINGQQINFNFPIKGIDRALTHLRARI